jgi:hypothetical protein
MIPVAHAVRKSVIVSMIVSMIVGAIALAPPTAARAQGAAGDDGVFTVVDVDVDVTAETAAAARETAIESGHRAAFDRLMRRLVPNNQIQDVPQIDAERITQMVRSFGVDNEKTSAVRYLARLRFDFDRVATRRFLRESGTPFAETKSKTVLVLPVLRRAGIYLLWDAQNTWLQAWQALEPRDGLVPMIVPVGDLADINDISADQAVQGRQDRLDVVLRRYGATDAVLALAQVDGSGLGAAPTVQITLTRFGSQDSDRSTVLSVPGLAGASVEDTIAAAAPRVASQIEEDWKLDNLLRFDLPQELIAVLPLQDLADWVVVERLLSEIAFVESSELLALSRSGATVRLRYFGNQEQLGLALSQRDVRLTEEDDGWVLRHAPGAGSASAQ